MAMNPMQRKARNSFLLGMMITLLITSVIIALLFLQVTKLKQEADKLQKSYVTAYVLQADIESGINITVSDVTATKISKNMLPNDYISASELTETTIAKVSLKAGTVLTSSIIEDSEEQTTKDIRMQEYNMLVLPTQLEKDDYIDIRWMLPNGQDYIVVSKKRVMDCNENTVWLKMGEDELLTMSGAIVEAYTVTGSKLYAVTYVEPGMQETAFPTYVPSNDVITLINSDKNITNEAMAKLRDRYTDALRRAREQNIQNIINNYSENSIENIEAKLEEEIARQQEARQMYLDQLDTSM